MLRLASPTASMGGPPTMPLPDHPSMDFSTLPVSLSLPMLHICPLMHLFPAPVGFSLANASASEPPLACEPPHRPPQPTIQPPHIPAHSSTHSPTRAHMQEHLVEDLCETLSLVVHARPALLQGRKMEGFMVFFTIFLGTPSYVKNPYLR
jgi:hypothetical protein